MKYLLIRISIIVMFAVCRLMAVRLANSMCENTYCLYLWENDDIDGSIDGYTWRESAKICEHNSTKLASIPNSDVQSTIRMILNSTVGCWIGGRRSHNENWKYSDGRPYEIERPNGQHNCIHYDFSARKYTEDNCDESMSHASSVCEISLDTDAACQSLVDSSISVWFSGVCYVIQGKTGNWYDQQTLCANIEQSGHLPYTNIGNETLLELIHEQLNSTEGKLMWTGIVRYPWKWDIDESSETMKYFSWETAPTDVDVRSNYCVSIDSVDATWSAVTCDTKKQRFVCKQDVIATTPRHSFVEISTNPQKDTTTEMYQPIPTLTIIITVVVAVLVVAAVVIAVIMLRKRQLRKSPKAHAKHVDNNNPPKDNSANTQGGPSDTSDSQYAEIDLDEPMPENTISPYGEYEPPPSSAPGPKNRVSAFFSGVAARIHGSRLSTTEDECVDNELYSQSRKRVHTMDNRKKQKPVIKAKKPSKLMSSLRPEVGDLPNGAVAERPEIEHIESPTGDIYAMSMKPGKDLTHRSRESFI